MRYRRFRLYCVLLEQCAKEGICGGREFVCGVSGRSSCERGHRREKRCHDTKLFGGYGRLVGQVLPNGCHDRFDNRVGYGLGFRLPRVRCLGFYGCVVLALFVDQKRFARLRSGAPNVPQLTQIDIDLDGLVCGVPREPCHNLVIDNLGQVFGDLFFLKGMGGVQRQAQALVAGAHHFTELAALLPTTVDTHAFPKAVLATVDMDRIQAVFAVLVALGRKEYGRGKHGVGHGRLLPK